MIAYRWKLLTFSYLVVLLSSHSSSAFLSVMDNSPLPRGPPLLAYARMGRTYSQQRQEQQQQIFQRKTGGAGPLYVSSGFGFGGLSGNLISQIAVFAIQVCLKEYIDVSCDVSSFPPDLLRGRIGPVTVKGKGWKSSRGLTCKAIEASVDTCQLDIGRVLSDRVLVLTSPAEGKAMIALTARDFGNFITHPRVERARIQVSTSAGFPHMSSSSIIEFSRDNVVVDPARGAVTFYATCAGESYVCVLKRVNTDSADAPKAVVEVRTLVANSDDDAAVMMASRLSKILTNFFNQIVFELYDGLFLSFRDMMVTDKGKSPSVLLALNIRVEKFPSPAVLPNSF